MVVRDVIALAQSAIDLANGIRGVADKMKDADVQNLIADLRMALVDLKLAVATLKDENLSLADQIRELESRRDEEIDSALVRKGNLYEWRVATGKTTGPFCMACWDNDRKLINLILESSHFGQTMRCGRCDILKAGRSVG